MHIKDLFAVPEGKNISEKMFGRVLLSSVCSILLCTACLVGTTWAWFTAEVKSAESSIVIGEPEAVLLVDDADFVSGALLEGGEHKVTLAHGGNSDAFAYKSTLYVTLTVDGTPVYVLLNAENGYRRELTVQVPDGAQCALSYEVSWFAPAGAGLLEDDVITVAADEPDDTDGADEADDAADAAQPSTDTPVVPDPSTAEDPQTGADTADPAANGDGEEEDTPDDGAAA